jgi:hypothetical protein
MSAEAPVRYRAQALGVSGWVDEGLFIRRQDAERDALRMALAYATVTRVIDAEDESRSALP